MSWWVHDTVSLSLSYTHTHTRPHAHTHKSSLSLTHTHTHNTQVEHELAGTQHSLNSVVSQLDTLQGRKTAGNQEIHRMDAAQQAAEYEYSENGGNGRMPAYFEEDTAGNVPNNAGIRHSFQEGSDAHDSR